MRNIILGTLLLLSALIVGPNGGHTAPGPHYPLGTVTSGSNTSGPPVGVDQGP